MSIAMEGKRTDSRMAPVSPRTMESRRLGCAGFSLIEMIVVVVILGLLAAIVSPMAAKWIRRSDDVAAYSSIRQVLALARLEAVKRTANIVVEISLSPDNRIRLKTFQDRANVMTCGGTIAGSACTQDSQCAGGLKCMLTSPLPGSSTIPPTGEALAAGNCVQDSGFSGSPATDEPTLGDVTLPPRIHLWKNGGAKDDVADAVRFDKYLDTPGSGNTSCASSKHRIIFLPSGGISVPQDSGSATDRRGIYFADEHGKNFFRVTVESDFSGKARLEKYVKEASGYFAPNSDPVNRWRWL